MTTILTICGFLFALLVLGIIVLLALCGANEYRCPHCGEDMECTGAEEIPQFGSFARYRCPKCGKVITIRINNKYD